MKRKAKNDDQYSDGRLKYLKSSDIYTPTVFEMMQGVATVAKNDSDVMKESYTLLGDFVKASAGKSNVTIMVALATLFERVLNDTIGAFDPREEAAPAPASAPLRVNVRVRAEGEEE